MCRPGSIALLVLLAPALARAHATGTSYVELDRAISGYTLALTFHDAELAGRVLLDRNGDGSVDDAELAVTLPALEAATVAKDAVAVSGRPCRRGPASALLEPQNGVRITAPFTCDGDATEPLDLHLGHLASFPSQHRALGTARLSPGRTLEFTASAAEPAVHVGGSTFLRFVLLGIEHIYGGLDHLLFLAGLLLVARSVRSIVVVVTSFTVAHSITLALGVTGVVSLSPAIVEPAIAVSIIFVAVENLVRPMPKGRAPLAFGFGLVHGLGFAGLLGGLGLTGEGLVPALAGFNLGVEAGQLSVVLIAAPVLLAAQRRSSYARIALPAGSAAIGACGAYWLVERLL